VRLTYDIYFNGEINRDDRASLDAEFLRMLDGWGASRDGPEPVCARRRPDIDAEWVERFFSGF
jgi:hypothetical protein